MEKLKAEANKCYLCKKPKCQQFCPISTPIPDVIKLFIDEEYEKAGEILFDNNPLTSVCCSVCPHEDFCLGNCIINAKGDPVRFFEIEKFLSEKYLSELQIKVEKKLDKRVAIIGAGPSGIALALILGKKGYDITLFEKNEEIGGLLSFGIPEYRVKKDIVKKIKGVLLQLGVKIRYNTLVGSEITIDTLLNDEYDSVFIGTGLWSPRKLNIKGESLGNVHYATNYLTYPKSYDLGDEVIVIGGGNVAIDSARTALINGAKNVTIMYRKELEDMPATKFEIDEAIESGVKFEFLKSPVKIVDEGAFFVDSETVIDEDGRKNTLFIEGTDKLKKANSIIIAVGQMPLRNISSNSPNLDVSKQGYVSVDENGKTSIEGIFSGGDVVNGASTVVEAVNHAKKIAKSMEEYLLSK